MPHVVVVDWTPHLSFAVISTKRMVWFIDVEKPVLLSANLRRTHFSTLRSLVGWFVRRSRRLLPTKLTTFYNVFKWSRQTFSPRFIVTPRKFWPILLDTESFTSNSFEICLMKVTGTLKNSPKVASESDVPRCLRFPWLSFDGVQQNHSRLFFRWVHSFNKPCYYGGFGFDVKIPSLSPTLPFILGLHRLYISLLL